VAATLSILAIFVVRNPVFVKALFGEHLRFNTRIIYYCSSSKTVITWAKKKKKKIGTNRNVFTYVYYGRVVYT
jgi:hypothetical protein